MSRNRRHASIPGSITDAKLDELARCGLAVNPTRSVSGLKPWITVETLTFLKGRKFRWTVHNVCTELLEDKTDILEMIERGSIALTMEGVAALIDDKFRSRVRPASFRFSPVPGHAIQCVVVWDYDEDRAGRLIRYGDALPLPQDGMFEGEYLEQTGNAPMKALLTFIPEPRMHRGEKVIVGTSIAADGRPVHLNPAFDWSDMAWGEEVEVLVLAEGDRYMAVPVTATVKAKAQLAEVVDGIAKRIKKQPPRELEPYEYMWGDDVLNVFHVLNPFGVSNGSTLKDVEKARKKMEMEFHPDTDPVLAAYRKRKLAAPEAVVLQRQSLQFKFRSAFEKLINLIQRGGAEEEEPAVAR